MKHILLSLFLLCSLSSFAKKVKFAVNMTGLIVNSTGVHVTGDFQAIAGFDNGDWQSNTTPLTQESADTNIYSIVVDIPAFTKYEYKFLNGDQFYDVEFVPVESRVGYNFNDNRWLYVDSLANDTTFVGAILFGGNAPVNKKLIRFLVNMENETSVATNGVHISTSFSGNNPARNILYNFDSLIYEGILYADSNVTHSFRYYNGSLSSEAEVLPLDCSVNEERQITLVDHFVLPVVCFASCSNCNSVGLESITSPSLSLYPNPAQSQVQITSSQSSISSYSIFDMAGQVVRSQKLNEVKSCVINQEEMPAGIYFVQSSLTDGSTRTLRLIWN